jgi:phage shock protein C
MLEKRLMRSRQDKMLGGVCGGVGDYLGVDPTLIRLAFVAATLLAGWGPILYIVLWVIVPEGDTDKRKNREPESPISDSYKVRVQVDGEEE